uniref:Uncharacterized protein n=1 Tax=Magnetococcus massalia (strain MO-1) TaxID=451514 RepID=A0A1S7LEV2_MAGMO|nr:conserved protein of unknown function [Candidatus Magnetococcus massalia]
MMAIEAPEMNDYYTLLTEHGEELLEEGADGLAVKGLFEAMVSLLVKPSPFNRRVSMILRHSAKAYHKGDELALEHFDNPLHCLFFLRDLFADFKKKGAQA